MKKAFLLLIPLLLGLGSCRKNKDITDITIIQTEDPELFIETSFSGKVVDENGEALQNALVEFGTYSTQADIAGNFEFKNVSAKSDGALLKATINGYFVGSTVVYPKASALSYVQLTLLEKGDAMIIDATSGGEVEFPDGHRVKIEALSLVQENGNIYAGDVYVYAQWIDPTAENLADIMPGPLFGKDAQGNEVALSTYGMINLALETASGEELEIANNKTAEFSLPIPAELQSTAPETMPAWFFDFEEEQWAEEGICIKVSDYYKCTIAQIAIWNCDIPVDPIFLSGNIYNNGGLGLPAAHVRVCLQDLTTNFIYGGYTDNLGYFGGNVPRDVPLQFSVKDQCGNLLYTAEIGPFTEDTELQDITLDVFVGLHTVMISGSLKNCNGDPVTFGQVGVFYNGEVKLWELLINGEFNFGLIFNCATYPELTIVGYDLNNRKKTIEMVHSSENDIILGDVSVCEEPDDYMLIDIDGTEHFAFPCVYTLPFDGNPDWLNIAAYALTGNAWINNLQYQGVDTYENDIAFDAVPGSLNPSWPDAHSNGQNISLTITEDDGEYIIGTMEGTVTDLQQTQSYNMSLEFKAKKK